MGGGNTHIPLTFRAAIFLIAGAAIRGYNKDYEYTVTEFLQIAHGYQVGACG